MTARITTSDGYKAEFKYSEKRDRALGCALDIRKFEIDLYWKRATYFWMLLAATFAGYFALAAADKPVSQSYIFLITCIGLVLSTGWYLVNRGSKYWQENWERHVDSLEDEFMGPLYKMTIPKNKNLWWHFWKSYPYSVSKVNQLISLFVALIWLGLAVLSFPASTLRLYITDIIRPPSILAVITLVFIVLLFWLGRSGSSGKPRPVDFLKSKLDDSGNDKGAKATTSSGSPQEGTGDAPR